MQACSSSGICSAEPNPIRWLNAERAEWGGGCSAAHVSGEKVDEELAVSASFGGNFFNEERGTDANFVAADVRRR